MRTKQSKLLRYVYRCRGEDWRVEVTVTTNLTLDKDFFFTEETRTVKHGEEIIFSREFKNKFDRTPKT